MYVCACVCIHRETYKYRCRYRYKCKDIDTNVDDLNHNRIPSIYASGACDKKGKGGRYLKQGLPRGLCEVYEGFWMRCFTCPFKSTPGTPAIRSPEAKHHHVHRQLQPSRNPYNPDPQNQTLKLSTISTNRALDTRTAPNPQRPQPYNPQPNPPTP